jgi:hypothetical protein
MPTMQTVSSPQEQAVPANKSRIVFMRSTFIGHLINATLYDVTKGEPEFLGIIPNASRIVYDTEPGERIFMVQSEAADFLKANMTAGKTYYALVTPRMGVWVARFSMAPVRRDGTVPGNTEPARIAEMKTNTKVVANTNETKDWFQKNLTDIKAKQAEYFPAWQKKPAADMEQVTLQPYDGN